ncbi:MAG: hypothetical protein ACTSRI_14910 [Promethearchaeota archaeon]
MPEANPPQGVKKGSLEHQLFITLTVSIDYLRDAHILWDSARKAHEDPDLNYLFEPQKIINIEEEKIAINLKESGMSKRFNENDAKIMKTVANGLLNFFKGNPENILKQVDYDGNKALKLIRNTKHEKYFPYLKGPKIGSLWVRMLKDVCYLPINLLNVPIAVDVHIARATFTSGALIGEYQGTINGVRKEIEDVWFGVAKKIREKEKNDFYALNFDEPLWTLSKFGCKKRTKNQKEHCPKYSGCPIKKFCVNGLIKVAQKKDGVQIKTSL